jgi:Fe-S cluster assembly protein SufD
MSIQVSSTSNLTSPDAKSSGSKRDGYLIELLKQRPELDEQAVGVETATWLNQLRDRTAAWVQEQVVPTTRHEEWRFTDLSPLVQVAFQRASQEVNLTATDIEALTLPEAANSRLVFVNGVYAPQLSSIADLPEGLVVGNLAQLSSTHRAQIQNYLAKQQGGDEVFTALNTANLSDMAIAWIPKNLVVETPLHLLFIATPDDAPTFFQPRCLVIAEANSALTLVEDYIHLSSAESQGTYFTNTVTEIWAAENAQVNHTRIQRDRLDAFHIGKTAVTQDRDSRYTCTAVNLGAKLSRHNLEVFQAGEQTQTTMNGLTLITGEQLADTHSVMAYNKPYGISHQLHKCIISDRAHAVFNGKVFVPKPAQLTNAQQLNRNLLLSPRARVDTKPQLEITADNVKCSHGATVSQLEADEVFYLQSRGIDQASAQNLLIYAFAAEIIEQIPVASIRKTLSRIVSEQTS